MYLSTTPQFRRPLYRRRRGVGAIGLGAAWNFSVSPGDPCYDATHSPGQTHYRFWFPGMSAQEAGCSGQQSAIVATDASVFTPGLPVGYDPTTGAIDASNTTGATVPPAPYASAFTASLAPGLDTSGNEPFPWGAVVAAFGVAFGLMWLGGRR
jgi:hypothetical protein